MSKFLRLLHLIDSSLPTGAFAYSYGLESAINQGFLKDSQELKNYLYTYLQQSVSFEFPFIRSTYLLNEDAFKENELITMILEYDAMILVPSLHKASLAQGRNWYKMFMSFYPEENLHTIENYFHQNTLPFHFIFIITLCLKHVHFTLNEIKLILLHMALRDQISAAIRLGVIGSMEAHELQHAFYSFFEEMISGQAELGYKDAYKSSYLLDSFQMLHENIYSKLFQN